MADNIFTFKLYGALNNIQSVNCMESHKMADDK